MKIHPRRQRLIDLFGHDPLSLDEIAQAAIVVINDNVRRPDSFYRYDGNNKVIGFAWDLTHSNKVSNTHHAPLNGQTNWGGMNPSAGNGYPGWEGRIWVRFKQAPKSFSDDTFLDTLIHPYCGGGGTYDGLWKPVSTLVYETYGHKRPTGLRIPSTHFYSYQFMLFDSDFPQAKDIEDHKKLVTWNTLQDKQTAAARHSFKWEDQATLKFDKEFMAEFKKRAS
jgi:hypothetical protein